jgi:hypothetical protein
LRFRYPGPGSVKHTEEDKPYLYKKNWKLSYRDHPYNIRPKEVLEDMSETDHYMVGPAHELDPNDPSHKKVLERPVRNRKLHPSPIKFTDEEFKEYIQDKDKAAKLVREF